MEESKKQWQTPEVVLMPHQAIINGGGNNGLYEGVDLGGGLFKVTSFGGGTATVGKATYDNAAS